MNAKSERDYTSTLLRMAGNIAGPLASEYARDEQSGTKDIAEWSVDLAEAILTEVLKRQSKEEPT